MKKNVYLDCGGHHGEGLREFIGKYKMDENWIIETFEPNPECNLKNRISDISLNIIVHDSAVWVYDGYIEFSQENHEKSNSKSPTDGKSSIDGWGSVITELNSTHLKYAEEPINVPCIDFNGILNKYPKNDYNVIVKMDIEGAEYSVLRHILMGESFKNINEMYVEWHFVDFDYENQQTTNGIINQLKHNNIKVYNWK